MKLTLGGKKIIHTLEKNGYSAYVVGGAVRDFLRGINYSDVDITTSATPSQMLEVLKDFKIYPTGIKHGTLTVCAENEYFEVTTFRTEEGYSDNRRPDSVNFVTSLKEDLKRRDFTINAMAFNESTGIVDYFNGQEDLKNKIIKTVGEPNERFNEDALRILRALRFASVLDFDIDQNTKNSILENYQLLKNVAIERIYVEFTKLLCGKGVYRILSEFKEVVFFLIPEFKLCDGFEQKSKYHCYDVYTHILKSVENTDNNKIIRWATFLHDIEKPSCFTIGNDGAGHFYGHQVKSADTAKKILKRFKSDNDTINTVYSLIYFHDLPIGKDRVEIKRFLRKHGYNFLKLLASVKIGDSIAHATPFVYDRIDYVKRVLLEATDIMKKGECFTLKHLEINGNDLKALGYKGQKIKEMFEIILEEVIKGNLENDREKILSFIKNV